MNKAKPTGKAKLTEKAKLTVKLIELQERITRVMMRQTPDAWMDVNLTFPQLRTLFFIDYEGSTNFERLASALGVARRDVYATVSQMVRKGLVKREKHPQAPRIVLLKTTDEGEALLAKLRESRMTRMSGIMAKLSVEELSTMVQSLTALAKAMGVQQEGKRS